MTAFGQYEDDDSASTLKQRDHKDATDLVVRAVAYEMIGASGQEGASLEEQPAITASDGQPGNVAQPAWWDGGDTADSLTTTSDAQRMPDKQRLQAVIDAPEAKMLFVRNGVEVDRHGKKAGKGALIATEEAPTLDAGNHWALFQPQDYSKSRRPQSDQDAETWVDDGDANTLNTFDLGETRTTHAIVEEMVDFGRTSDRIRLNAQTAATLQSGGGGAGANTGLYMVPEEPYCLQGSLEGRSDTAGPQGAGWKHGETFTLNTADRHAVTDTTHAIVEPLAPSLTASNDPSRSPQSSEVTQQVAAVHASGYGVRRLTPVECERLQAFPDGWTEPAGSDSARYKALGNAVTVNTVRWVLGRMLEQS
jgi:site-specific DNA-cytosine methylase